MQNNIFKLHCTLELQYEPQRKMSEWIKREWEKKAGSIPMSAHSAASWCDRWLFMLYGVIFIMNANTLETTQSTQFTRTRNKCVNIHKFESCLARWSFSLSLSLSRARTLSVWSDYCYFVVFVILINTITTTHTAPTTPKRPSIAQPTRLLSRSFSLIFDA